MTSKVLVTCNACGKEEARGKGDEREWFSIGLYGEHAAVENLGLGEANDLDACSPLCLLTLLGRLQVIISRHHSPASPPVEERGRD